MLLWQQNEYRVGLEDMASGGGGGGGGRVLGGLGGTKELGPGGGV